MKNLNRVSLIGNVGNEIEYKVLNDNIAVAKFSLATTETYKDNRGQSQSNTEWHTVVVWRGVAELAQKYLKKGALVYVEGKIKYRSYEDKDGNKRTVAEIIGEDLILLDKKNND